MKYRELSNGLKAKNETNKSLRLQLDDFQQHHQQNNNEVIMNQNEIIKNLENEVLQYKSKLMGDSRNNDSNSEKIQLLQVENLNLIKQLALLTSTVSSNNNQIQQLEVSNNS